MREVKRGGPKRYNVDSVYCCRRCGDITSIKQVIQNFPLSVCAYLILYKML